MIPTAKPLTVFPRPRPHGHRPSKCRAGLNSLISRSVRCIAIDLCIGRIECRCAIGADANTARRRSIAGDGVRCLKIALSATAVASVRRLSSKFPRHPCLSPPESIERHVRVPPIGGLYGAAMPVLLVMRFSRDSNPQRRGPKGRWDRNDHSRTWDAHHSEKRPRRPLNPNSRVFDAPR